MKGFHVLIFLLSFSVLAKEYPLSDHYDGEKFFNLEENARHTLWDVLKWKLTSDSGSWPEHVPNESYLLPKLGLNQKAVVTFINHATFLIQLPGLNILTDPIFSKRASPLPFIGPQRVRDPGIKLEELPKIDIVLISHNHYDHLDLNSLKQIDGKFQPVFLVPLGNEKLLKEAGIQNVQEMDWWQTFELREHSVIFAPSQHWSARGIFDRCETLWGSFYIRSPSLNIYFGGDTGYASHFKQIKKRLGTPHLSLLPIGAYEPRYFMKVNHMNPEEAVMAHLDLDSKLSIGMHFGTFPLTDEKITDPILELGKAQEKLSVNPQEFIVLDQGESKIFQTGHK